MDILAHGLWANAVYAAAAHKKEIERPRREVWQTFFWGTIPDLFAFGFYVITNLTVSGTLWPYAQARFEAEWSDIGPRTATVIANFFETAHGSADPFIIPYYVHMLYNLSHSFVIFAAVFLLVWFVKKRPNWLMGAWGFHILLDIFSHSDKFFPTPIFYPLSSFHFDGVSWADPNFMLINYSALVLIYGWFYLVRRRKLTLAAEKSGVPSSEPSTATLTRFP